MASFVRFLLFRAQQRSNCKTQGGKLCPKERKADKPRYGRAFLYTTTRPAQSDSVLNQTASGREVAEKAQAILPAHSTPSRRPLCSSTTAVSDRLHAKTTCTLPVPARRRSPSRQSAGTDRPPSPSASSRRERPSYAARRATRARSGRRCRAS